jgi:hypothetical protein
MLLWDILLCFPLLLFRLSLTQPNRLRLEFVWWRCLYLKSVIILSVHIMVRSSGLRYCRAERGVLEAQGS